MLVVIADHFPAAVRGRMKLWFIEVKPNVFVSGIKNFLAQKIIDYLFQYCPAESGLLILVSSSKPPGYKIRWLGQPKRKVVEIFGLQVILEKSKI